MAWVMFKQTSLRFGWISGRSGLMSSSRHWKGLWRFERASIGGFQTSKVRDGSGRFCRCLEGSRNILNKKHFEFSEKFFLAVSFHASWRTLPVCPEILVKRRCPVDESCPWDDIPWHPRAPGPLGKSLGFPQQARRIWDGRSGLPNLGSEAKTNVYESMMRVVFFLKKMIIATGSDCVFKISILEFWNEYKIELLICFFHVRSLFGHTLPQDQLQIVGCKRVFKSNKPSTICNPPDLCCWSNHGQHSSLDRSPTGNHWKHKPNRTWNKIERNQHYDSKPKCSGHARVFIRWFQECSNSLSWANI